MVNGGNDQWTTEMDFTEIIILTENEKLIDQIGFNKCKAIIIFGKFQVNTKHTNAITSVQRMAQNANYIKLIQ